ncbi:urate hydroxylase PuuD [Temperatibacter marinus]|uniref:Urate hydroxylase PuuD n=1 Tax=Temperatibacter marinus TaxID=1456591 RepID=A0AA52EH35_9PROT|nr:urate hydroxylase PuuD [Temperatibacter marinus]WND02204.1 urate hydroxylase PuuD [Temperatibacter marinus]
MGAILSSLRNTVIVGIIVMLAVSFGLDADGQSSNFIGRYLHVISGVMWIGLLWYFNFVQIPTMPSIPDELKPAVGKHIAPEALFWFRWGAMATLVTGLYVAMVSGYMKEAFMLEEGFRLIGVGMYMAIIMWFNVWFVIWPNQKKALGMVEADADTKAAAARTAMLFSRTNTLLSIPMLYCMVGMSS